MNVNLRGRAVAVLCLVGTLATTSCRSVLTSAQGQTNGSLPSPDIRLVLGDPRVETDGRLMVSLTVTGEDIDAWRECQNRSRYIGCAYYSASGQYFGQFLLWLARATREEHRLPLLFSLDLSNIQEHYGGNTFFRERLGEQSVLIVVFVNFDNRVRYDMDELMANSLHSNTISVPKKMLAGFQNVGSVRSKN